MGKPRKATVQVVRDEAENLGEMWLAQEKPNLPKPIIDPLDVIEAPYKTGLGEPSFYKPWTFDCPHRVNSNLPVPSVDAYQKPVILKSLIDGVWIYCENEKQAAMEARRHGKVIFGGPGSQYFPLEVQAAHARRGRRGLV